MQAFSPAATDLGLGDDLLRQLQEQEAARKKDKLPSRENMSPAAAILFGVGDGL